MAFIYEYKGTASLVDNLPKFGDDTDLKVNAILAEAYPKTNESPYPFDESEHPDDPKFVICVKDYEEDIVREFTVHLPSKDFADRIVNVIDGWTIG